MPKQILFDEKEAEILQKKAISFVNKVKEIISEGWPLRIGVDGAVKDSNIKEIVNSGVDFITVGSYLLKGDIEENLERYFYEETQRRPMVLPVIVEV